MMLAISVEAYGLIALGITAVLAPSWLAWWNARLTNKEMKPNGGTSLKDQVSQVIRTQELQFSILKDRGVIIGDLHEQLREVMDNQINIKNTIQGQHEIIASLINQIPTSQIILSPTPVNLPEGSRKMFPPPEEGK